MLLLYILISLFVPQTTEPPVTEPAPPVSLTVTDASKATISGTSTLHDWVSDVNQITGGGTAVLDNGMPTAVSVFRLQIPVSSIESGKNKMDKLTYEALRMEEHPNIVFTAQQVNFDGNKAHVRGTVAMAGQQQNIEMDLTYRKVGDKIIFNGSKELDMRNWGISPPTVFLGTLKTGEMITVDFELHCAVDPA